MRTFEIVLLTVEMIALVLLVLPLPSSVRWLRHALFLPLPTAAIQVLLEGMRWQMVPAYALGGVFAVVGLVVPARRHERTTSGTRSRRLYTGVGVVTAVLALAVSAVLPAVVPVFRFPPPTGPYGIGTVSYHWVDTGRPEVFTADPHDHRELVVQIWYPARVDASAPRAAYVPDSQALVPLARLIGLPGFALSHLEHVTTNAVQGAPVADGARTYPLLVLATGRGGYRQYNTLGVEELVSRGYVIAAIDHPYSDAAVVFPDGRVASLDQRMLDRGFVDSIVPFLARDALFTLDRVTSLNQADSQGVLTGRIDLTRVGLFGLSLGGEITAEACRLDPRFTACLPIDVWMPPSVVDVGLDKPTMWITRDAATMRLEGWTEPDIARTLDTMRAVYAELRADGYFVQVPGMFHPDFGDTQLLSPLLRPMGITGPMNGERAHAIVNAYTTAFFDRHVKGVPSPLLDGPAKEYPDVIFDKRTGGR